MAVSIHVVTSDATLRRALTARLERAPGLSLTSSIDARDLPDASDIVIAPSSDCSPERCLQLAQRGLSVIVLAAIPREAERLSYTNSGSAAYVPMAVDSEQLLAAIGWVSSRLATGAGGAFEPGGIRGASSLAG